MKLEVVEPLRLLFKAEVRRVGRPWHQGTHLGRHPFPGPGLAIRIWATSRPRKCVLQEVDHIYSGIARCGFVR